MYLRMRGRLVFSLSLIVAYCFIGSSVAADRATDSAIYRLETKPVRRVKATLTTVVDAPCLMAQEWIVSAPAVPELPSQQDVVQSLSVANKMTRESSLLKREILSACVTTAGSQRGKHRLSMTAEYHATLFSRRLVANGSPASLDKPPAADEDRSRYLRSDRFVDYDDRALQLWLAKRGLKNSTGDQVAFARQVFRAIREDFAYSQREPLPTSAAAAVSAGAADCGGLSMIFAAALRANGIPARLAVGRWAESAHSTGDQIADQMHVKAEFYADGVGWIPVDCSGAIEDRTAAESQFFGHDAGDFLTFHVDCGMQVDTVHFGVEELVTLQDVAFWAKGDGSFQGITTSSDWRVTDEPLIDALAKHP